MTLDDFNQLPTDTAREHLARCCGASGWISAMLERRPFADFDAFLVAADVAFALLERADWLEAFAHHPKIGDVDSLREKFAATANWAAAEQSAVAIASEETIHGLAEGNEDYQQKFGYIFIVCASGKSAGEMLAILQARLLNDPETELQNAAVEQMKITDLRLHKLIEP